MEGENKHLEHGILVHSNRKNMEMEYPDILEFAICNINIVRSGVLKL